MGIAAFDGAYRKTGAQLELARAILGKSGGENDFVRSS